MNDLIQKQLAKVQYADLSKFDADSKTYFIKKRVDIKLEVDKAYLIRLKPTARHNQAVIINWNAGSFPKHDYLKIDVSKTVGKMVKVVSVAYDNEQQKDLGEFWSGWLHIDELEVISAL